STLACLMRFTNLSWTFRGLRITSIVDLSTPSSISLIRRSAEIAWLQSASKIRVACATICESLLQSISSGIPSGVLLLIVSMYSLLETENLILLPARCLTSYPARIRFLTPSRYEMPHLVPRTDQVLDALQVLLLDIGYVQNLEFWMFPEYLASRLIVDVGRP